MPHSGRAWGAADAGKAGRFKVKIYKEDVQAAHAEVIGRHCQGGGAADPSLQSVEGDPVGMLAVAADPRPVLAGHLPVEKPDGPIASRRDVVDDIGIPEHRIGIEEIFSSEDVPALKVPICAEPLPQPEGSRIQTIHLAGIESDG